MSVLVYRDKATACAAVATVVAAHIIEKPASVLGLDYSDDLLLIYRALARMTADGLMDWGEVRAFGLSEYVRADAESSIQKMMASAIYDRAGIHRENRRHPDGNGTDWSIVCNDFEDAILNVGGLDTVLLSVRTDGSIAYNLGAPELAPVTHVERTSNGRVVTAGISTIMAAQKIVVLITGADKATVAGRLLNGPIIPSVPASYLQLHQNAIFILDEDAASEI